MDGRDRPFPLHAEPEVEEGGGEVGQAPVEVRAGVDLDEFFERVAGDGADGDADEVADEGRVRFEGLRQGEVDFERVQGVSSCRRPRSAPRVRVLEDLGEGPHLLQVREQGADAVAADEVPQLPVGVGHAGGVVQVAVHQPAPA